MNEFVSLGPNLSICVLMKKEKDTRDVSLSIGREEKPCEDTNEEETVYKPGRQLPPETEPC